MTGGPGWRAPREVAELSDDTHLYLAVLPDGPIVVLNAAAAAVWEAAQQVPPGQVVKSVADHFGVPGDLVADQVGQLLEQLTHAGLLTPTGGAGP